MNAEIEILNSKLEESNQAKAELESKINKTLEEIKTADNDEIKNHLEKLEKVITIFLYLSIFDEEIYKNSIILSIEFYMYYKQPKKSFGYCTITLNFYGN